MVGEMFFLHEKGAKIGIWTLLKCVLLYSALLTNRVPTISFPWQLARAARRAPYYGATRLPHLLALVLLADGHHQPRSAVRSFLTPRVRRIPRRIAPRARTLASTLLTRPSPTLHPRHSPRVSLLVYTT